MREKAIKTENHGPRRRRVLASLMAESPSAAVMVAPTASCLHYQYVGLCLSISYAAQSAAPARHKATKCNAMLRDATKNEPSCPAPTAPIPPPQIGLKYQKDPLAITHVDRPPRTPPPLHLRRHVHDDRHPGRAGHLPHAHRHLPRNRHPGRQRHLVLRRHFPRRNGGSGHHPLRALLHHLGQRHRAHGVAIAARLVEFDTPVWPTLIV